MDKCNHGCIKDACAMCRVVDQRDQLREALEEILHDTRSYDAKQIARAALKATEEG